MVWLVSWSDFVWFAPGGISGLVWFSVRAKTSRRSHAEEPHTTPGYVWQSTRARPVWRHVGSAGSAWSEPGGRRSPTTASASWCLSTATRLKFDRCLTPTLWGGGWHSETHPVKFSPTATCCRSCLRCTPSAACGSSTTALCSARRRTCAACCGVQDRCGGLFPCCAIVAD